MCKVLVRVSERLTDEPVDIRLPVRVADAAPAIGRLQFQSPPGGVRPVHETNT